MGVSKSLGEHSKIHWLIIFPFKHGRFWLGFQKTSDEKMSSIYLLVLANSSRTAKSPFFIGKSVIVEVYVAIFQEQTVKLPGIPPIPLVSYRFISISSAFSLHLPSILRKSEAQRHGLKAEDLCAPSGERLLSYVSLGDGTKVFNTLCSFISPMS